jgi:hypothetical protein
MLPAEIFSTFPNLRGTSTRPQLKASPTSPGMSSQILVSADAQHNSIEPESGVVTSGATFPL